MLEAEQKDIRIFSLSVLCAPPQGGRLVKLHCTRDKEALNLFQSVIQVILMTETASSVSACGHGWMSLVLREEGEEATV